MAAWQREDSAPKLQHILSEEGFEVEDLQSATGVEGGSSFYDIQYVQRDLYDRLQAASLKENIPLRARLRQFDLSKRGFVFSIVIIFFAITSCITYVMGTYDVIGDSWDTRLEIIYFTLFFVDYVYQLLLADRWRNYVFSPRGVADLLSLLPAIELVIPGGVGEEGGIGFLRYLRMLRLVRLMKARSQFKAHTSMESATSRIIVLITTILAILFIGSGTIHVVDAIQVEDGDTNPFTQSPLAFHEAFYFLVVTVTTVGYGDISPVSDISRVVVILIILISFALIPRETSKLLQFLNMRRELLRYRARYKGDDKLGHIVLCGSFSHRNVLRFLSEFYHRDHGKVVRKCVLIGADPPTERLEAVLTLPTFRNMVMYTQGSIMSREGASNVDLEHADAVFFLTDQFSAHPREEDRRTVLRAVAVRAMLQDSSVPLVMQLLHPRWYVVRAREAPSNIVISMQELRLAMVAHACLAKGATTFFANLVRSYRYSASAPPSWNGEDEYRAGMSREIYRIDSPASLVGLRFFEVAEFAFQSHGIIVFGMNYRVSGEKDDRVLLFPSQTTIPDVRCRLFCLADSEETASAFVHLAAKKKRRVAPRVAAKGGESSPRRTHATQSVESIIAARAEGPREHTLHVPPHHEAFLSSRSIEECLAFARSLAGGASEARSVGGSRAHGLPVSEPSFSGLDPSDSLFAVVNDKDATKDRVSPESETETESSVDSGGSASRASPPAVEMAPLGSGSRAARVRFGPTQRSSSESVSDPGDTSEKKPPAERWIARGRSLKLQKRTGEVRELIRCDSSSSAPSALEQESASDPVLSHERMLDLRVTLGSQTRLDRGAITYCKPQHIQDCIVDDVREDLRIRGHILVLGVLPPYFSAFMRQLRAWHLNRTIPVVVLAAELPSMSWWEDVAAFPELYIVVRSGRTSADMRRAGVDLCRKVVRFSQPADVEAADQTLADADAIFTALEIRALAKRDVDVVVELANENSMRYMRFFEPSRSERGHRGIIWSDPQYASGSVYASSVLDTLLSQVFYTPKLVRLLDLIVLGAGMHQIDTSTNRSFREVHSHFFRLDIDSEFVGQTFGHFFGFCVTQNVLPVALYRCAKSIGAPQDYVYTCPSRDAVIRAGDRAFVFSAREMRFSRTADGGINIEETTPSDSPSAEAQAPLRQSATLL